MSDHQTKQPGPLKPYINTGQAWAFSLGATVGWGSLFITGTTCLPAAGPLGSAAGMLIGFSGLQVAFVMPVNELSGFMQRINTTGTDMARVEDIMRYKEDERYEKKEYADIKGKLDGNVELDNISFI